ncbi:bifunctional proline dehydrogenase/L-glutamate gamma-semialdehyde dehydrogenase PutA [Robiginitomaculum antarcticum]|uniref:bifunctional proline dehydrogenase/L-glutamate gamma-semialdehyde dehydrogenase PutA n=1 Tax=Robiginitomaculum antarcticum TaxID=437507 RepID=UPI0012E9F0A4|nr:bifunctional proline dehydrogenase/L-glutamate gamma-semialdehyde dehydrogenase PutA [Robiginitomaculum antarcticum]
MTFNPVDVLKTEFTNRPPEDIWPSVTAHYDVDETDWLTRLTPLAAPRGNEAQQIEELAGELIAAVRHNGEGLHKIDALLLEYSLDTREGVLLMCLAEALLRVPDKDTADALIEDKIGGANWNAHLGQSESLFANASTWGLMVAGKVVTLDKKQGAGLLSKLVDNASEPVVRKAMREAMKIMGRHFVLGQTIGEALKRARKDRDLGASHSFDMLGEAALTEEDASRYEAAYAAAITAMGKERYEGKTNRAATISIKLSALHPRYDVSQTDRVMTEMSARVKRLLVQARSEGVGVNIDAEEADRLELSLKLYEQLFTDPDLLGWGELGIVVQAYSKRALPVLAWITALAKYHKQRIPVRLVKGAYWDAELKKSQQKGLPDYPVYTQKPATDLSYLACARFMLSKATEGAIYPQFATHNAHSVAAIRAMAPEDRNYEFQRLNGMGDALYDEVLKRFGVNVCIYAPVGHHKDLLAYLVRRLLENGANSSFVHRLIDAQTPIGELTTHPVNDLNLSLSPIPKPAHILPGRENSRGVNLDIESQWQPLRKAVETAAQTKPVAKPIILGKEKRGEAQPLPCPFDHSQIAGHVIWAKPEDVTAALDKKVKSDWPVAQRAVWARDLADRLDADMPALIALCQSEAGKTWQDGIDEIREAVDFCRYYADQLEALPDSFIGSNGQSVSLDYAPRGTFACISPWNFPLAIFLGQVVAALLGANRVIAKPAQQTPLIAYAASRHMMDAGLPKDRYIFAPGGPDLGQTITAHPAIDGLAFTGSTNTARKINQSLAARDAAPAIVIAETGGLNAMIVDSTALPEQVAVDAVRSAFHSAGQRCSSARILYLQDEIYDRVVPMITGMMAQLRLGDPRPRAADIGPVIDAQAKSKLDAHIQAHKNNIVYQTAMDAACDAGTFVAPTLIKVGGITDLVEEQFGPVLHVARFKASKLDAVISDINASGYGLTFGVQSRIDATCTRIAKAVRVGNVYVNRDQVGAVVGVQPFGGRGLSGTGPKAGGPHYLPRFMNVTAAELTDPSMVWREGLAKIELAETPLPGPTGEDNRLSYAPKGTIAVLCGAPKFQVIADDMAYCATLAGNVVIIADNYEKLPQDIDGIVYAGPADNVVELNRKLANREGAIILRFFISDAKRAPLPDDLHYFVTEKVITINTAAIGGNAELLGLS